MDKKIYYQVPEIFNSTVSFLLFHHRLVFCMWGFDAYRKSNMESFSHKGKEAFSHDFLVRIHSSIL